MKPSVVQVETNSAVVVVEVVELVIVVVVVEVASVPSVVAVASSVTFVGGTSLSVVSFVVAWVVFMVRGGSVLQIEVLQV